MESLDSIENNTVSLSIGKAQQLRVHFIPYPHAFLIPTCVSRLLFVVLQILPH